MYAYMPGTIKTNHLSSTFTRPFVPIIAVIHVPLTCVKTQFHPVICIFKSPFVKCLPLKFFVCILLGSKSATSAFVRGD